jgi:hypothetical protein
MNHGRNLLYIVTSRSLPTVPTAHGAGIDFHRHRLTGSRHEPRNSGEGFEIEVHAVCPSPSRGNVTDRMGKGDHTN